MVAARDETASETLRRNFAATELHRVTCGRGRARAELAPVRPVEISCVAIVADDPT